MNILNNKLLKKLISFALKKGKIKWLPYCYKWFPKNWTDHEGSNFFHFSAKHQNDYLFDVAVYNQANINEIDKKGNAPIHRLIEACFIVEKENKREKIKFDFNEALIEKMIQNNADINQWIKDEKKEGNWGEGVATFSRHNIMGSPIELLVGLFWDQLLAASDFDDKAALEKYHKLYTLLSNAGAKINMIVNTGEFFNLENETILDAMQTTESVIVSHFFVKYITNQNDLEAITPFLYDPNISFSLADGHGNTVLHHLFGRISTRYNFLPQQKIEEILMGIYKNPKFNPKYLDMENDYRLSVMGCFKGKALEYKDFMNKLILTNKLNKELAEKIETPKKRMKI